jgi:hypothetical protein
MPPNVHFQTAYYIAIFVPSKISIVIIYRNSLLHKELDETAPETGWYRAGMMYNFSYKYNKKCIKSLPNMENAGFM